MEQTLITLPKAARQLGVTSAWLRSEAVAGRVPCLPVGKSRFLFNLGALSESLLERASAVPMTGGAANA